MQSKRIDDDYLTSIFLLSFQINTFKLCLIYIQQIMFHKVVNDVCPMHVY